MDLITQYDILKLKLLGYLSSNRECLFNTESIIVTCNNDFIHFSVVEEKGYFHLRIDTSIKDLAIETGRNKYKCNKRVLTSNGFRDKLGFNVLIDKTQNTRFKYKGFEYVRQDWGGHEYSVMHIYVHYRGGIDVIFESDGTVCLYISYAMEWGLL